MRRTILLTTLFLLAGSPAASSEKKEIVILFTTDLYGRFTEVVCGKPAPAADFANLVSAAGAVRQGLEKAGKPLPLVLNGGDNIGPHAFGRFVLSKGKPGARMLAGWLRAVDYELVALGNQDFYAAPDRLRAYLEAGVNAGLVFSAANLDCESKDEGLCPFIGPGRFKIFERAGLKIAVFSLIHGDLAADVSPQNLKGIKVADPFKRAKEVAAGAREAGADLVFVLSHLDHSETSPRKALKLARSLPGADLIIANGFTSKEGERGIGVIRFADGATPIVGSDLFGQHLGIARLTVAKEGDRWRVKSADSAEMDPSKAEPEPVIQGDLADLRKSYCADWDKPVGQGKLQKSMSAADFEQYLMEIMRHTTTSELAFINQGLVNPRTVFPLEGSITRHDFFSGLPHRNEVYTFKLNVKELTALCAAMAREKGASGNIRLLHRGLICGKTIKVNGRALESGESYTAVTVEYLAKGMLGYFKAQAKKMELFRPVEQEAAPVLGQIARDFLSSPRFSGEEPEPIGLEANFVDLAHRLRWIFSGMLNFSLADTRIDNSPAYGESQLTRDEFIALKGELRGKLGASSSFHAFYAELLTKYAKSSTNEADFVESEDLTTFNLLYKLNALRSAKSGWYVPALYIEGQAETEITKPDERDFHHLELTGTMGARFKLLPTLEAKIGAGLRHEALDEDADPVYGVDVGYELVRTNLFSMMGSPFQFESKFSAFFGDIGRTNTLKGTWTNRIYFALVGPIFFTVTHDLFFFRYSSWDYGLASDLTIGLSYSARTSVQTF
jgi:2',3'-cyclic-nucleotide 2'-phosphodiesterase (5'-nucleotidase family)